MTPSELERLATLEALQEAHSQLHTGIERRLETGSKKFEALIVQTTRIETMLADHCKNSSHGCNGKSPSKPKEIVIKIGVPAAAGGGVIAIMAFLIQLAGG